MQFYTENLARKQDNATVNSKKKPQPTAKYLLPWL